MGLQTGSPDTWYFPLSRHVCRTQKLLLRVGTFVLLATREWRHQPSSLPNVILTIWYAGHPRTLHATHPVDGSAYDYEVTYRQYRLHQFAYPPPSFWCCPSGVDVGGGGTNCRNNSKTLSFWSLFQALDTSDRRSGVGRWTSPSGACVESPCYHPLFLRYRHRYMPCPRTVYHCSVLWGTMRRWCLSRRSTNRTLLSARRPVHRMTVRRRSTHRQSGLWWWIALRRCPLLVRRGSSSQFQCTFPDWLVPAKNTFDDFAYNGVCSTVEYNIVDCNWLLFASFFHYKNLCGINRKIWMKSIGLTERTENV